MFSLSIALGQISEVARKVEWIHQIGAWWLVLFIAGVFLIFVGIIVGKVNWRIRKWLSILGLIIIAIGIFGAEIVYLIPYLGEPVVSYQECKEISFGLDFYNIVYSFGCIFVGYAPAGTEVITIITFVIFGMIAPIAILVALFYEFTDFIIHPGVRNVITVVSAIIAYRFLLATLFIDVLGYGFAGLGILLFNYFFFMVVFRTMKGLWAGAAMIENIVKATKEEMIADLTKKLRDAESVLVTLGPGTPEYKHWKNRVDQLRRQLEELQRKG